MTQGWNVRRWTNRLNLTDDSKGFKDGMTVQEDCKQAQTPGSDKRWQEEEEQHSRVTR